MGVLGTELTSKDTTKIVVAEVEDIGRFQIGSYEIVYVYGNNEDFDVVCMTALAIPIRFISKEDVNQRIQEFNPDLPVYTCKISHDKKVMSREDAFAKILAATEPWKREV